MKMLKCYMNFFFCAIKLCDLFLHIICYKHILICLFHIFLLCHLIIQFRPAGFWSSLDQKWPQFILLFRTLHNIFYRSLATSSIIDIFDCVSLLHVYHSFSTLFHILRLWIHIHIYLQLAHTCFFFLYYAKHISQLQVCHSQSLFWVHGLK